MLGYEVTFNVGSQGAYGQFYFGANTLIKFERASAFKRSFTPVCIKAQTADCW